MKLPFLPNHDDPSFFDFLTEHHPTLTPTGRSGFLQAQTAVEPMRGAGSMSVPHATTVLAIKYQQGVVITGDRRATEGFQIAERRIVKVLKIEECCAMGIGGAAGPCMEMAKLLRVGAGCYGKWE